MASELPPGPRQSALRQTVGWVRRPQQVADQGLREFGDVFTLRVFGAALVLHSRPEHLQELVSLPPELSSGARANRFALPLLGSESLLLLDGDAHLAARKLLLPPFHGERLRRYEVAIRELAEAAVERLPADQPIDTLTRMQALTLDVIVHVVFGIDDGRHAAQIRPAVVDLLDATTSVAQLMRTGAHSLLRGRDGDPHVSAKKIVQARQRLVRLLEREIDRRRSEQPADRGDVLSMLLEVRDADGGGLDADAICDQLLTLLVAGHETTSVALAWACERIARHAELQERLADEALDGRHELLDATVKETLRARPVLPLFMRETLGTVEVGGRSYPAGTMLAGAPIVLHRRPELYPDPDAFRPERFIGEGAPSGYEWMPFGGGVRRCIGASFALLEMRVILAALLAERRLEPVDRASEGIRRRAVVLSPARRGRVLTPRRRSMHTGGGAPPRSSAVA